MDHSGEAQTIFAIIEPTIKQDRKPKGENMSKINNAQKFTVAAVFGAAAIFDMLSFGSSAEAAKSVASCQGATGNQAMSSCEKFVKENGRPLWMIQTRTSCREATICRG